MKKFYFKLAAFAILFSALGSAVFSAEAKAPTLTCVGIYSETSDGYVSYRVGTGAWIVVKVGDVILSTSEIKLSVERDWVEFIQSDKPNVVFEVAGSEKGVVTQKAADLLKSKGRTVSFPKESKTADPKFKDKLVVKQYLGRQIYRDADYNEKDIKYGDILDRKGKVTIIAINNTITLMNDTGAVTTVIGPLKFDVEKVLTNQNLYKFLNVAK